MSEKDSRDSFYFLNAYQDGITPGQKITIQHNVSYNDWRAAPHLAPLVKLTDAEINQRKEASITYNAAGVCAGICAYPGGRAYRQ